MCIQTYMRSSRHKRSAKRKVPKRTSRRKLHRGGKRLSCGDVFRARRGVKSVKDMKTGARLLYSWCKHIGSRGKYDREFPGKRKDKKSFRNFDQIEADDESGMLDDYDRLETAVGTALKKLPASDRKDERTVMRIVTKTINETTVKHPMIREHIRHDNKSKFKQYPTTTSLYTRTAQLSKMIQR